MKRESHKRSMVDLTSFEKSEVQNSNIMISCATFLSLSFFFLFLSREVESFEYKFKREICSWHRPPESIQNVTREECGGFMATQRNIWRTCTFSLPSSPPLIRSYDSASLISVIYKKRFFLRPFHGNANDSTTE